MEIIRCGFARGCRRFDFQVGGKGSYKEDYGCETEPTQRLLLYNDSAAAHVMRSARDLRQAFRTLRAHYVEQPDATRAPSTEKDAAQATQ
jgi:CelD/BcsL family acetyltransferase involved in cellulose biosynthesis